VYHEPDLASFTYEFPILGRGTRRRREEDNERGGGQISAELAFFTQIYSKSVVATRLGLSGSACRVQDLPPFLVQKSLIGRILTQLSRISFSL
jgi:hypothetical protein